MNILLECFKVNSYRELFELAQSDSKDEEVIELRQILSDFGIEVGDSNE